MTVATRPALQTLMRAAAVDLLKEFARTRSRSLQIYAGRPLSLFPPTAFVDRLRERLVYHGQWSERTPTVDVLVVHALFDAKDAVAQRDDFVDSFIEYVSDRPHQAGANTTLGIVAVEDDPNWIPDWLPVDKQRQHYATTFSLEGYGGV